MYQDETYIARKILSVETYGYKSSARPKYGSIKGVNNNVSDDREEQRRKTYADSSLLLYSTNIRYEQKKLSNYIIEMNICFYLPKMYYFSFSLL